MSVVLSKHIKPVCSLHTELPHLQLWVFAAEPSITVQDGGEQKLVSRKQCRPVSRVQALSPQIQGASFAVFPFVCEHGSACMQMHSMSLSMQLYKDGSVKNGVV
jgi:hypothetical protein